MLSSINQFLSTVIFADFEFVPIILAFDVCAFKAEQCSWIHCTSRRYTTYKTSTYGSPNFFRFTNFNTCVTNSICWCWVNKHDIILILIIICHHTYNALSIYSTSLWISRCYAKYLHSLVTDDLMSSWQIIHSWGLKRSLFAI